MAKNNEEKELTLEEAINAVKRLSNPDRSNEELELLKEASAKLLEEVQPGFEFEGDDDDGPDAGALKEELTKSPGFFEQMGTQISNVGVAGVIALSSAAYFQIDTVVEETRTVAAVAEEKWEEVKMEHPNINWDDPLAGFTTIIGVGDVKIDLDPPEPSSITPSSAQESEDSEESEIKESQEPEPKAEEAQVKEKPKKKSGGLFKSLFGKDDEKSEEPEDEPREEPQKDDTIPDESENEETSEKPEAKTDDGKTTGREPSAEPTANANTSKSNGIKQSSGGGLFSRLFGSSNDAEVEEVVENSEVSPEVSVEPSSDEGAPPPITVEQAEVEVKQAPQIDIQELSEGIQTGDIQLGDEPEVNIDSAIEKVITPIDNVNVVSPSGGFGNLFGPYSPGYDNGETDATPV